MFQEDEEGKNGASMAGPTSQALKSSQGTQSREQRREKFLVEFNNSEMYDLLRQKLKRAIYRLAVEKFNKQVDHNGLSTK